ncbi:CGNR zinc finger domain-containing protein [Planococcus halocryophilus]|uniref:CGNR zinc finger domain-containing protein n=1 Tax=Planococcus halocryophilus TaxID=1215089 RepID=UPI001F0FF7E4|nr:CGNR zinc finger domain-containing protein [Planococcus halocryophilus]MCH4827018.1 CGNR zinc finger domain-containing protein [Planococcus halocryophilus]
MTSNNENYYSYVSDYLFINFLNTINIKKIAVTDFLEEENGIEDWLSFMRNHGILNLQQVEQLEKSSIDVKKMKDFRDQWRNYFEESEELQNAIESLAMYTKQTPLYFDLSLKPIPSKGGTEGLLAMLSFEMLQASQSGIFKKLKKCDNSVCYAFFIDTSGKRKWCSMEVCGNREKARRHYAKKLSS